MAWRASVVVALVCIASIPPTLGTAVAQPSPTTSGCRETIVEDMIEWNQTGDVEIPELLNRLEVWKARCQASTSGSNVHSSSTSLLSTSDRQFGEECRDRVTEEELASRSYLDCLGLPSSRGAGESQTASACPIAGLERGLDDQLVCPDRQERLSSTASSLVDCSGAGHAVLNWQWTLELKANTTTQVTVKEPLVTGAWQEDSGETVGPLSDTKVFTSNFAEIRFGPFMTVGNGNVEPSCGGLIGLFKSASFGVYGELPPGSDGIVGLDGKGIVCMPACL